MQQSQHQDLGQSAVLHTFLPGSGPPWVLTEEHKTLLLPSADLQMF